MSKVITYTQEMYNEDMERLLEQIRKGNEDYALVVGLARGGLIPAVQVSHKFDVPLEPLQWQTRSGGVKERKQTIITALEQGQKILIVDDLIDSGRAMRELIADLGVDRSKIDIAVLYYNPSQEIKPDFFARIIDRRVDERWIVFWWEAQ